MEIAKIKVSGATASAEKESRITAGMVGVTVRMQYADIWDGLHKTVVFRAETVTKDVITDDEVVKVPKEVVATKDVQLYVGVYGVDAEGNLVIPTIWAGLGLVRDAANPSGDITTDPDLPVWAQLKSMIGNLDDLDTETKNDIVAAVNEALAKGVAVDEAEIRWIVADYLSANPPTVTESDPTVPAWAKKPTKPTYTAAEVGALPDTYTPPDQTAQQVGADPAGTAASAVSQHNVDAAAHNDLRLAMKELANRINAALDSDDTTLDQMSEVVAYIKANKSLIDAITTSKVSVADIVNDLVTNVTDKPLSAAQGVVIKTLIDALRNDKLDAAELTNAVNTALAQAKESGEFDGQDGKSAYAYAQDGGYTGTETEFAEKLAQEQLVGTTDELTPTQVYNAVSAGIPVKVQYIDSVFGVSSFTAFNVSESLNVIASQTIAYYNGVYILGELFGDKSENIWGFMTTALAQKTDIPAALPNPNSLTFTGAAAGIYDGSAPLSVKIPSAVTDDHINSLIDTKLGVIENGSY